MATVEFNQAGIGKFAVAGFANIAVIRYTDEEIDQFIATVDALSAEELRTEFLGGGECPFLQRDRFTAYSFVSMCFQAGQKSPDTLGKILLEAKTTYNLVTEHSCHYLGSLMPLLKQEDQSRLIKTLYGFKYIGLRGPDKERASLHSAVVTCLNAMPREMREDALSGLSFYEDETVAQRLVRSIGADLYTDVPWFQELRARYAGGSAVAAPAVAP